MAAIAQSAASRDIAVIRTASGVALAPMSAGKVLEPDAVAQLSDEQRQRLAREAEAIEAQLQEALRRVPQLQREQRERIRKLDHEVTQAVVRELLADVRRAFAELPPALEHLGRVERDIVGKTSQVLRAPSHGEVVPTLLSDAGSLHEAALRRYRVNLVADHRTSAGAPVVMADHPTSSKLVGKVEHLSQYGVLVTDFNLIKPGALHAANGGYLIIDARRLLMQPVSWEQLKRTLRSGEIRIESVAEALDLSTGMSLEPDPIPFRGKVVLIGEPWLYYRMSALDPEFDELFKVASDFENDIERTPAVCRAYAELLAQVARKERLPPLTAPAVARLLEHASRLAEDSTRLSMQVRSIFDLMREAAHWASEMQHARVEVANVERAIAERERRHGRVRERVQARIADGTLLVETSGTSIGQVNGLSVVQLGEASFGFPTRITAQVRLGKGEVVDIQREAQLGGPIHSKGVLTLSAFLGGRYQMHKPLSLRATLVFEQVYGQVEGDSASLAELLALLSAIGKLPLAQGIAITGSIDQHGRVQAVGGVNDKIEGFFDVCRARGLDGSHGVIIPAANVKHLMLRQDVVSAAASGRFHVWVAADVDQAMEVALGLPAGNRAPDGAYPEGGANRRIEEGLDALARAALEVAKAAYSKT
jgi:lon-related putative ATP-dependent protease